MASGTTTTATGSSVRLSATGESDILLGQINATNVSLLAQRDILDNNGATVNVVASVLRMVADAATSNAAGQIGQPSGGAIDTDVTTLAASSADGIYVQEANGLTVDATGAITVQRANFDSTLTPVVDASLSDLRTTDAGPIKVVVDAGALTVNEGSASGSDVAGGVVAATSGDVLLEATVGDVVLNAAVSSTTGHITVTAGDDVDQNANIATGTPGTVLVTAANGTADGISGIDMASGTSTTATSSSVRLSATGESDILLGQINATNVSLLAQRSILDNNGATVNVVASVLRMVADSNNDLAGQIGSRRRPDRDAP